MKLFQTTRGLARQDGDKLAILNIEEADLDAVLAAAKLGTMRNAPVRELIDPSEAIFAPVVGRPSCFVIAGLNYRAHCEEIGRPIPERLLFGMAPGSAAHGSGQPVSIPASASTEVDYEGEIGVVISSTARRVNEADAWSVVAGIVPLNDVSARDVQAAGTLEAVGQAKGFPSFKPLGPCMATLDEFRNPLDIGLITRVNGEVRQQGRSKDMVFSIPHIIEIVTSKHTLEAGDIICTGTPGGVAHGGKHPYLKPGDTVEVELEGLPILSNVFTEAC